jgi:carboxylesterase type B
MASTLNSSLWIVAEDSRISVFGFPNSPQLTLTAQSLGFLDQRAAHNMGPTQHRSFGGSQSKATIFGESAGVLSVDALVTSPPHSPPFRAAILESGTATLAGLLGTGVNSTNSWLLSSHP